MWNNTRKDKVQADFFVKKTNNAFFSLILDGDKSNDKLSSTYMLINLLKKLFFNNNKYKNSINMFIEHDEIYFLSLKKINSIPINLRSGPLNMAIQGMNDKSLLLVLCKFPIPNHKLYNENYYDIPGGKSKQINLLQSNQRMETPIETLLREIGEEMHPILSSCLNEIYDEGSLVCNEFVCGSKKYRSSFSVFNTEENKIFEGLQRKISKIDL